MHRCQVKIRYYNETPQEHLTDCGDHANKKIGEVWMCDYHYGILQHTEDELGRLKIVTDCTNFKE